MLPMGLGLREPLKSCILPFMGGRYFSHPVASCSLVRQVKISCYSTKGNERGQSARVVLSDPARKWMLSRESPGQGVGGGSTRNGVGEGIEGKKTEKEKWFNYALGL